jgi:small conductance mechanosensitive channel
MMGVESLEVGVVNLRMVARTLPGKQFEVGRRLRIQVVQALASVGVAAAGEVKPVQTP